jgi:hypothetical protein
VRILVTETVLGRLKRLEIIWSDPSFRITTGVMLFVGGGVATLTGYTMSRSIAIAGLYEQGGDLFLGNGTVQRAGLPTPLHRHPQERCVVLAGELVAVGCPSTDAYGLLGAAFLGIDWFVGSESSPAFV